MLGAGPARASDLLAKRFACAEYTDTSIRWCDARLFGVVFHGFPIDIDSLKHICVFGLERSRESSDATAHHSVKLRILRPRELGLDGERIELSASNLAAPRVIDDRVAENTIKPADRGFANLTNMIEAPDERFLNDLLGKRGIVYATLDECEKLAMTGDERRQ